MSFYQKFPHNANGFITKCGIEFLGGRVEGRYKEEDVRSVAEDTVLDEVHQARANALPSVGGGTLAL